MLGKKQRQRIRIYINRSAPYGHLFTSECLDLLDTCDELEVRSAELLGVVSRLRDTFERGIASVKDLQAGCKRHVSLENLLHRLEIIGRERFLIGEAMVTEIRNMGVADKNSEGVTSWLKATNRNPGARKEAGE